MYWARHGQTAGNASNSFRGGLDFPLDPSGERDAHNLSRWFADKELGAIHSSPKKRTRDTAEAIATPKRMKVQVEPNLYPINVGYLAGEPKAKHEHVMDYFEKYPNEKIPMGESINEFRERTQPPIKQLLVEAAHSKYPTLAVVHSSIIHELNHVISGDHNQELVKPGGVVGVFKHPTKGLQVRALLYPEKEAGIKYHG